MTLATTNVTEMRTKTAEVLRELSRVGKIVILRGGKVEGYLLSADEYENLVAAFEAQRDLRGGKTRDYKDVMESLGF